MSQVEPRSQRRHTPANPQLRRLIHQLRHKDLKTRRSAARDIGQMGPSAADAVSALTALLRHEEDKETIGIAAHSLSQIGPAAVAALAKLMGIGRLRTKVGQTLRRIGTPEAMAVVEAHEKK